MICSRCHLDKPTDLFYKNKRTKSGWSSWCKICARHYYNNKRRNIQHLPEYKQSRQEARLKNLYGISNYDYECLINSQFYTCAICFADLYFASRKEIHIDHNHMTGKVRGILCRHCNRGLGGFKDNPIIVKNALSYLEFHDNCIN